MLDFLLDPALKQHYVRIPTFQVGKKSYSGERRVMILDKQQSDTFTVFVPELLCMVMNKVDQVRSFLISRGPA
jgi:hypothetical protein